MRALNHDKSSDRSSKLFPLSVAAQRSLRKLGLDLALARRRRRLTQGSLAERMGASVSTVKRMEAGDPKVPIHFFARAMGIFGELDSLANVMDATKDQLGLSLENENLPKRVRAQSTQSRGNAGAM